MGVKRFRHPNPHSAPQALVKDELTQPLDKATIREWAQTSTAHEKAMLLLESYKEQAIRSLQAVDNANLKGLLRRVIGKIFNDLEIKGWCREFEVKNGAAHPKEAEPAVAA